VGGVIVERNRGVVGVRELEVRNIGTVDLELDLVRVEAHIHGGHVGGSDVLDGVVEVELLCLGPGGDRLLNLGDEHVLGLGREHLTLLGIEVGVVRVDFPLVGIRGGTPRDAEFDIVVLERDEGERRLPVLTESEAEGVEPLVGRATVKVTGHRLGGGGRRKGRGDEGGVGRVLLIDHLTTDEKLHLGDGGGPIGNDVRLGTIRLDGHEIDIVEHVTLALKADGGHTVV